VNGNEVTPLYEPLGRLRDGLDDFSRRKRGGKSFGELDAYRANTKVSLKQSENELNFTSDEGSLTRIQASRGGGRPRNVLSGLDVRGVASARKQERPFARMQIEVRRRISHFLHVLSLFLLFSIGSVYWQSFQEKIPVSREEPAVSGNWWGSSTSSSSSSSKPAFGIHSASEEHVFWNNIHLKNSLTFSFWAGRGHSSETSTDVSLESPSPSAIALSQRKPSPRGDAYTRRRRRRRRRRRGGSGKTHFRNMEFSRAENSLLPPPQWIRASLQSPPSSTL